jgi:hypothetical protein
MNVMDINISTRIKHMIGLKEVMEPEKYRFIVATIVADVYYNQSKRINKSINRKDLMFFTGLKLEALGLENYTYNFYRSWKFAG